MDKDSLTCCYDQCLVSILLLSISTLGTPPQDAIASCPLAELEDEQAWSERFPATTDAPWDRLAAAVRQEMAAGDT